MISVGQLFYEHRLGNGMVLLAEPLEHVRSAALTFLVPAGCAYDPDDRRGIAGLVCELLFRGAGPYDNRALSLAMDRLGLDHSESVRTYVMQFKGSTLARNLPAVLELYADILRRPHLPESDLDAAKALALQDIHSLEDSPQEKLMVEFRRRYYPEPLNKDNLGRADDIAATTIEQVRSQHQRLFRPNGSILSIAGRIDWPQLKDRVESLFSDWPTRDAAPPPLQDHQPQSGHIPMETHQTHLALACPSAGPRHEDFYLARGLVGVLSGGMSSRLFTEVREKRGLCYSVHASHEVFPDRGTIIAHAGSRNDRAQETLDVILHEFSRLRDGISDEEVDRVKASLKASLIMAEESPGARAATNAIDWYYLGRLQPLDEVQQKIESITPRRILEHLERFPFRNPVILTLGPKPLQLRN